MVEDRETSGGSFFLETRMTSTILNLKQKA